MNFMCSMTDTVLTMLFVIRKVRGHKDQLTSSNLSTYLWIPICVGLKGLVQGVVDIKNRFFVCTLAISVSPYGN